MVRQPGRGAGPASGRQTQERVCKTLIKNCHPRGCFERACLLERERWAGRGGGEGRESGRVRGRRWEE